jgi:hypothetical protein
MSAIIYFGEILVASLLAIALLAILQLRMSFDAALFASGVVKVRADDIPEGSSLSTATFCCSCERPVEP